MHDATRRILLLVGGILLSWVVELFRFLFRVQVVKVTEPFIEAMNSRQELGTVAEVVRAELARGIALRLEHLRERRVFFLNSER